MVQVSPQRPPAARDEAAVARVSLPRVQVALGEAVMAQVLRLRPPVAREEAAAAQASQPRERERPASVGAARVLWLQPRAAPGEAARAAAQASPPQWAGQVARQQVDRAVSRLRAASVPVLLPVFPVRPAERLGRKD
jgi:hypothetical protein